MTHFDVAWVRGQFPALSRTIDGQPVAYLDGPGGTQTPQGVLDAVREYLVEHNSNTHGFFATTEETDQIILAARAAMADMFGCLPEEVSFGANMTTLCFMLAQSLASSLSPGDQVLITEIDHEGNRGPWLRLAERGVLVREVPVHTSTCTLDLEALERMAHEGRTKVIAVNYASNAVGTITDVKRVAAIARRIGALSVVDAVHYALHGPIDVADIGCDVLLCSAYKFFGPHIGVMYVRHEAAEHIDALRLRTQAPTPPDKFETGTLNHEGIAGTIAAVDFIAEMGRRHLDLVAAGLPEGLTGRRREVVAGMLANEAYEQPLARYLVTELDEIDGVTLYGPPAGHPRTSTVSFTLDGYTAMEVARILGERGLFVWDGHFYAIRLVERLGLIDSGGLVRVGLCPYTTKEELDRLLEAVHSLASAVR
ncbi:MAG TPA: cysteine desulfurase-like protein [Thermoleophilia bacterium]|nr:cysteine desulfurase-like protein [Thermoleophilia bacterium]HQG03685.1 cysteine desulfurase-like protein [Thermoleophilia bacterium]HQG54387.1 cysteine desulfurase-like protein [Thermoleophilia bacterium]HQJ97934.1 cysteine desulfurase-like protein [Thermoleophilia bacterium]